MLRQGLNSRPYWVVSLSIPARGAVTQEQEFKELALVRSTRIPARWSSVEVQR